MGYLVGSTVLILPGPTLTVVCLKDFTKLKLKTKDFFATELSIWSVFGEKQRKNMWIHAKSAVLRTVAGSIDMGKGMRFFLTEKSPRQQCLFCAHWYLAYGERDDILVQDIYYTPQHGNLVLTIASSLILAVLSMQMLLCRLLPSAETFAESTQEMKINSPNGRIFIKTAPIFPSTLRLCLL